MVSDRSRSRTAVLDLLALSPHVEDAQIKLPRYRHLSHHYVLKNLSDRKESACASSSSISDSDENIKS